jgi:hypothetical protein
MILDNRKDIHDTFYLTDKIRRLEDDIARHKESHSVANKLLVEERSKRSILESTVKFEVAQKYNAYKDLKVASELVFQLEVMIDDMNKLCVLFDKRIKKLKMEEQFGVSMKKFRKIIYNFKKSHTKYRIEKKNLDKVFEIK